MIETCKNVALLCNRGTRSAQLKGRIFQPTWDEVKSVLREGAVMCQGASYALEMKYKAMGMTAYSLGIKIESMSHVVVLVGDALTHIDPSFNLHYNRMSVFDVLTEAHDNKLRSKADPYHVEYIQCECDPVEPHPYKTDELVRVEKGRKVYKAKISVERFNNFFGEPLRDIYKGELLYVRSGNRPMQLVYDRIKKHIEQLCG